jgi:hypothetical protein
MATAKKTSPPTAALPQAVSVDSKGNQRVYVDLPRALVVKFNVLAAMRGVTKRSYMTALFSEAITRAATEAKL